jgi:hypothetical protein
MNEVVGGGGVSEGEHGARVSCWGRDGQMGLKRKWNFVSAAESRALLSSHP